MWLLSFSVADVLSSLWIIDVSLPFLFEHNTTITRHDTLNEEINAKVIIM